jgi:hypothetical protein
VTITGIQYRVADHRALMVNTRSTGGGFNQRGREPFTGRAQTAGTVQSAGVLSGYTASNIRTMRVTDGGVQCEFASDQQELPDYINPNLDGIPTGKDIVNLLRAPKKPFRISGGRSPALTIMDSINDVGSVGARSDDHGDSSGAPHQSSVVSAMTLGAIKQRSDVNAAGPSRPRRAFRTLWRARCDQPRHAGAIS